MKIKAMVLIGSAGLALHGCTGMGAKSNPMAQYSSPQQLIAQQQLHEQDYVYAWGGSRKEAAPQTMTPRTQLAKYCHANGGSFSLFHKSNMPLMKNAKSRNALAAEPNVTQAIGAYQCVRQKQQLWIVSIEPDAELKSPQYADARAVRLNVALMSESEVRRLYKGHASAAAPAAKKSAPAAKTGAKTSVKEQQKEADDKKELPEAAPVRAAAETPQQQQMKLYVAARRDINSGKNTNNACNNAQRAYNYGKLQGTDGTRVYTESGMLVARCLTSISAYSTRFPNAKGQAKHILQNLANNYNHAGAKHMLNQLK